MEIQELAHKLVDYCRKGDYQVCYQELYSQDCESIEPEGAMMPYAKGLEAMAEKGKAWNEMVEEFHGGEVGDPIICGNHFSLAMTLEATFKNVGRMKMEEICVYEVRDGQVVKEQFFYYVPGK